MKFRLCEDLQEDLNEREQERNEIINKISQMLNDIDFEEKTTLNGISFQKSIDDVQCQFYIDTDKNKFSSYITDSETSDSYTFSQSGELERAVEACSKFISAMKLVDISI